MKRNIFYGIVLGIAALGVLASCDSDYLEQAPKTSISAAEAVGTTKAARMAVRGMARAMFTQYQDVDRPRGCNGEATFNVAVNDALGPDDVSYFHMRELQANWYTWKSMALQTSTYCQTAWMYCYNFVGQANTIIANIANAEGEESDRQFIEAQARTFRAHGYIKALQWFGPRWQDSNNGEKMAVVLRKEPGTAPAPLGSLNEVIDFIYEDLSEAERLYQASGQSRSESWEPDIYVAYGLHARAAMIKNDWNTAKAMAHNARQGREVMSLGEYFSGFMVENDEYMWTNFENDIYYSSPGTWSACNGYYPGVWKRCFSVNIDLYNQLDPNDQRRKLYFMPDRVADVAAIPGYESVATLTEADFWNGDLMDPVGANVRNLATPDKATDLRMVNMAKGFVQFAANNNAYASLSAVVRWPYSMTAAPNPTGMSIGASVKMWSYGPYGDSAYPYMRAAEMYLTEAEAAYMAGDEPTAKACLTAVNEKRITDYKCTTSGDALLNEIRVCRRIELWGEGHNFADFKRWNLPLAKRAYKIGDITSGNADADYEVTADVSFNNGWRLAIPQQEIDANPAIDRALLK